MTYEELERELKATAAERDELRALVVSIVDDLDTILEGLNDVLGAEVEGVRDPAC